MTELLTTHEAARALKFCPSTVRDMIRRGEIKAIRMGRQWRIRPEDLFPHPKVISQSRKIAQEVRLAQSMLMA